MTKKVYLAARYSRREELCGYRARLQAAGFVVTSRWLNGSHQINAAGTPIGEDGAALIEEGDDERAAALRREFVQEDVADVFAADALIAFTEVPRSSTSRGGRHVELGIAMGRGIHVIVVGPRENLFHWYPGIPAFGSFGAALRCLQWWALR